MIGVHSFFAGVALGTGLDIGSAFVVFVAILAHKTAAAFAIGIEITGTTLKHVHRIGLVAFFSAITPAGIGVGIALTHILRGDTAKLTETFLIAVAAGTFQCCSAVTPTFPVVRL
jgi:solute carrier family 39 (zinc transporter), member 1/2/3